MHYNRLSKVLKVKALVLVKDNLLWDLTHHTEETLVRHSNLLRFQSDIDSARNLAHMERIVKDNAKLSIQIDIATLKSAKEEFAYIPKNDYRRYVHCDGIWAKD